MSLFGKQGKPENGMDPQLDMEETEDSYDDLPVLPKPRNNTVIAKGITLCGALYGEGAVQVEGTVEGEIDLSGSVVVSTTGVIKGPITADVVRVAGRVEGNVIAHNHLRLEKTGYMEGDMTTASLVVEDGGTLNGRTTMVRQEEEEPIASSPMDDLQFGANYPSGDVEEF